MGKTGTERVCSADQMDETAGENKRGGLIFIQHAKIDTFVKHYLRRKVTADTRRAITTAQCSCKRISQRGSSCTKTSYLSTEDQGLGLIVPSGAYIISRFMNPLAPASILQLKIQALSKRPGRRAWC